MGAARSKSSQKSACKSKSCRGQKWRTLLGGGNVPVSGGTKSAELQMPVSGIVLLLLLGEIDPGIELAMFLSGNLKVLEDEHVGRVERLASLLEV